MCLYCKNKKELRPSTNKKSKSTSCNMLREMVARVVLTRCCRCPNRKTALQGLSNITRDRIQTCKGTCKLVKAKTCLQGLLDITFDQTPRIRGIE